MSSGPRNVTSTTETTPPDYLIPGLQRAAGAAIRQFNTGNTVGDNIFSNLDQQFNRAADLTQTRLSSEFAGGGRNLGAAMPARSDELQTLASNIYDPSKLLQFDPTNILIDRLRALLHGGTTTATQPVFRQGIF